MSCRRRIRRRKVFAATATTSTTDLSCKPAPKDADGLLWEARDSALFVSLTVSLSLSLAASSTKEGESIRISFPPVGNRHLSAQTASAFTQSSSSTSLPPVILFLLLNVQLRHVVDKVPQLRKMKELEVNKRSEGIDKAALRKAEVNSSLPRADD